MRIAIGGIAHESCSFSPLPTRLEDFIILRGSDLQGRYPFLAALDEVTAVPLLWARGLPGGTVEQVAYQTLKTELLDGLRAGGPWDGVYLELHGALFVAGMEDAEGDLLAAVRKVVGPGCRIAASYDLHGNVSPVVMGALDILTAYRTAPHIDGEETRARAVRLLVETIQMPRSRYRAFVALPLLLPGERAMTTVSPSRELYQRVAAASRTAGVLDASLLIGYAWVDEPRAGASVVVVGDDEAAVTTAARQLATAAWQARHEFAFGMPTGTVDDCITQALAASEAPVFISDAGDNPTGGAVGDVPFVLACLLARKVDRALYGGLADEAAVARCFTAGPGAEVVLTLGGKLDPKHGKPLAVRGRVRSLHPGINRQAVVQVAGITVIVTAERMAFTKAAHFAACAVDPADYKLVVVKLGYLFPEVASMAAQSLLAYSPGAINPDLSQLSYTKLRRPIFPLDAAAEAWTPAGKVLNESEIVNMIESGAK